MHAQSSIGVWKGRLIIGNTSGQDQVPPGVPRPTNMQNTGITCITTWGCITDGTLNYK